MSAKKISHVQGKGSIAHNNRLFTPKNVDSNKTLDNVCYVKKSIAEVYSELFDNAVAAYNSKQKRSDRTIKNGYYEHMFNRSPCSTVVESANGQKSFYEDVVQIGDKDDTGVNSPDAETAKHCLDEYMKGFQKRNPNFIVFNSVLHMDEATPHLHIDYIPIGHYNRGVSIQNGIAQALKEMGHGSGKNAISRWRESERNVLRSICLEHGIEIAEEIEGRGYSMKVNEYKEHQERINAYKAEERQLETELNHLLNAKDIADSITVTGTKMPLVNNYIVSADEFETINEQKKALAIQQNEVHEMQKHFDKERLTVQSEWSSIGKEKEKLNERKATMDELEHTLQSRSAEMDRRESEIIKQKKINADMYDSQINLNENYKSVQNAYTRLERELRDAKRELRTTDALKDKIDDLEKQLEIRNDEYEENLRKKDEDISAVKEELTECKEKVKQSEDEISGLQKTINSLKAYIDKIFEIGEYMACKLRMDFEEIVERRFDGYSLKHIFGDNGRER